MAASSSNIQAGVTSTLASSVRYDPVNDRVLVSGVSGSSCNIVEYLPDQVWPKLRSNFSYAVAVQASGPEILVGVEFMAGDGSTKVATDFLSSGQIVEITTPAQLFDGMASIRVRVTSAVENGWFRIVVI